MKTPTFSITYIVLCSRSAFPPLLRGHFQNIFRGLAHATIWHDARYWVHTYCWVICQGREWQKWGFLWGDIYWLFSLDHLRSTGVRRRFNKNSYRCIMYLSVFELHQIRISSRIQRQYLEAKCFEEMVDGQWACGHSGIYKGGRM